MAAASCLGSQSKQSEILDGEFGWSEFTALARLAPTVTLPEACGLGHIELPADTACMQRVIDIAL